MPGLPVEGVRIDVTENRFGIREEPVEIKMEEKAEGLLRALSKAEKKGEIGPVLLERIRKEAKLPVKVTWNSAGYELFASKQVKIRSGEQAIVEIGWRMEMPVGTYGLIAPKSGLAVRKQLWVNGGIIDNDYRGEVGVILRNSGDSDVEFEPGDPVAQIIFMESHTPKELQEAEALSMTDRGEKGFGQATKAWQEEAADENQEPRGKQQVVDAKNKEEKPVTVCMDAEEEANEDRCQRIKGAIESNGVTKFSDNSENCKWKPLTNFYVAKAKFRIGTAGIPNVPEKAGEIECYSVEQGIQAVKAILFNRAKLALAIMEEREEPMRCRELGRKAVGKARSPSLNETDEDGMEELRRQWDEIHGKILKIVVEAKIRQNDEVRTKLMNTGRTYLAYYNPKEIELSTGISVDELADQDPKRWKGKNLLGETLMVIRDEINEELEKKSEVQKTQNDHQPADGENDDNRATQDGRESKQHTPAEVTDREEANDMQSRQERPPEEETPQTKSPEKEGSAYEAEMSKIRSSIEIGKVTSGGRVIRTTDGSLSHIFDWDEKVDFLFPRFAGGQDQRYLLPKGYYSGWRNRAGKHRCPTTGEWTTWHKEDEWDRVVDYEEEEMTPIIHKEEERRERTGTTRLTLSKHCTVDAMRGWGVLDGSSNDEDQGKRPREDDGKTPPAEERKKTGGTTNKDQPMEGGKREKQRCGQPQDGEVINENKEQELAEKITTIMGKAQVIRLEAKDVVEKTVKRGGAINSVVKEVLRIVDEHFERDKEITTVVIGRKTPAGRRRIDKSRTGNTYFLGIGEYEEGCIFRQDDEGQEDIFVSSMLGAMCDPSNMQSERITGRTEKTRRRMIGVEPGRIVSILPAIGSRFLIEMYAAKGGRSLERSLRGDDQSDEDGENASPKEVCPCTEDEYRFSSWTGDQKWDAGNAKETIEAEERMKSERELARTLDEGGYMPRTRVWIQGDNEAEKYDVVKDVNSVGDIQVWGKPNEWISRRKQKKSIRRWHRSGIAHDAYSCDCHTSAYYMETIPTNALPVLPNAIEPLNRIDQEAEAEEKYNEEVLDINEVETSGTPISCNGPRERPCRLKSGKICRMHKNWEKQVRLKEDCENGDDEVCELQYHGLCDKHKRIHAQIVEESKAVIVEEDKDKGRRGEKLDDATADGNAGDNEVGSGVRAEEGKKKTGDKREPMARPGMKRGGYASAKVAARQAKKKSFEERKRKEEEAKAAKEEENRQNAVEAREGDEEALEHGDMLPIPEDEKKKRDLKAEAMSTQHLMTHFPKNPFCPYCCRARMLRPGHRKAKSHVNKESKPEKFGDRTTGDHMITRKDEEIALDGSKHAFVMGDLYTDWIDVYPQMLKDADSCVAAMKKFAGQEDTVKVASFYSDNAPEIVAAAIHCGWRNPTCYPGDSKANGKAEINNRRVLEGTRTVLTQAGLPAIFWPYASRYWAMSHNITSRGAGRMSPWELRHKKGKFHGEKIPFGALIDYLPSKNKEQKESVVWDSRGRAGIFLGWHLQPGGKWKNEYYVADLTGFNRRNPNDLKSSVRVAKAQRVNVTASEKWTFPYRKAFEDFNRKVHLKQSKGDAIVSPGEELLPQLTAEEVTRLLAEDRPGDAKTVGRSDEGDANADADISSEAKQRSRKKVYITGSGVRVDENGDPIALDLGDETGEEGDVMSNYDMTELDEVQAKTGANEPGATEKEEPKKSRVPPPDAWWLQKINFQPSDKPPGVPEDFWKTLNTTGGREIKKALIYDYWVENPDFIVRPTTSHKYPAYKDHTTRIVEASEKLADQVERSKWEKELGRPCGSGDDDAPVPVAAAKDVRAGHRLNKRTKAKEAAIRRKAMKKFQRIKLQAGGGQNTRTIIEWCCGNDSRMGNRAPAGCKVVRITEEDNALNPKTAERVMKMVEGEPNVLLWVSIPCTGGSTAQRLNMQRANYKEYMKKYRTTAMKMFYNMLRVADAVTKAGGKVAIEWPKNNEYWKLPEVEEAVRKHGLQKVTVNACMVGLTSVNPEDRGQPVRKPWTIATNDETLREHMHKFLCPSIDHHGVPHAPCLKRNAKMSESYTDVMIDAIHEAWRESVIKRNELRPEAERRMATDAGEERRRSLLKKIAEDIGGQEPGNCAVLTMDDDVDHDRDPVYGDNGELDSDWSDDDAPEGDDSGEETDTSVRAERRVGSAKKWMQKLAKEKHYDAIGLDDELENQAEKEENDTTNVSAIPRMPIKDDETVPVMPVTFETKHRKKWNRRSRGMRNPFVQADVLVARPVTKKEIKETPAAQKAMRKEWDRLRSIDCWAPKTVREYSEVKWEARRWGKKTHFGRLCPICVEKGSELDEGDPNRKFKGRVVFLGNQVVDEWNEVALFREMSSSPATMEAAKLIDLVGLLPGNAMEFADATQAYTQANLGGDVTTWVRMPEEEWPDEWKGANGEWMYEDPVCILVKALYGHPDAGGDWEEHCGACVARSGFRAIPDWRSCYYHPEHKLVLAVYVDDFKLSGPADKIKLGWELIRKELVLDDPTPPGKYLGCHHWVYEVELPDDDRNIRNTCAMYPAGKLEELRAAAKASANYRAPVKRTRDEGKEGDEGCKSKVEQVRGIEQENEEIERLRHETIIDYMEKETDIFERIGRFNEERKRIRGEEFESCDNCDAKADAEIVPSKSRSKNEDVNRISSKTQETEPLKNESKSKRRKQNRFQQGVSTVCPAAKKATKKERSGKPGKGRNAPVPIKTKALPTPGKRLRLIEYDMTNFFRQCVDKYLEIGNVSRNTISYVSTPYLDESKEWASFLEQTQVDMAHRRNQTKSKAKKKNVHSDAQDLQMDDADVMFHVLQDEADQYHVHGYKIGALKPIAARVLMKIMYGARMCRWDLLRCVQLLAARMRMWTELCDRMLHRLICYIHSTPDLRLVGWVGDDPENLGITVYSDADFAGCTDHTKSTSGVFIRLDGPNTSFPISAMSKKQSSTAFSTPEAEIVAANLALRVEGLPVLTFWEQVFDREVQLDFKEDNKASIIIFKTGYSAQLRHISRTQKVNLRWVQERFQEPNISCEYALSCEQSADIFTKKFTGKHEWRHACNLINHIEPNKYFRNMSGKLNEDVERPDWGQLLAQAVEEERERQASACHP